MPTFGALGPPFEGKRVSRGFLIKKNVSRNFKKSSRQITVQKISTVQTPPLPCCRRCHRSQQLLPMSYRPSAPLIAASELPPCACKHRPAAAALPPSSSCCRRPRLAARRCRAALALLPLLCLPCHRAATNNTAHLPLIPGLVPWHHR